MIYVGLDDTDTLESPGTNQLARHLVRALVPHFEGQLILRHQLLEDPRVPCTRKNGCASIRFQSRGGASVSDLIEEVRQIVVAWCPRGSDPGLCVAKQVTESVIAWGRRCQRELVSQQEAHRLAVEAKVDLQGLGGSNDGVIGALAAVGLMATLNDGRVIYLGTSDKDLFDVSGVQPVEFIRSLGVSELHCLATKTLVTSGHVDLGKRLRPNYRDGKVVLFIEPIESDLWRAVRVV